MLAQFRRKDHRVCFLRRHSAQGDSTRSSVSTSNHDFLLLLKNFFREKIQLDLDINTILNEFHHIVSSVEGIRTVLPTSTSTQPPVSFLFESISPEDLFYVKDIYRPNQLLSANIDVNYPSSKDYSDFSAQTKTLLESLDSLVDKVHFSKELDEPVLRSTQL